MDDYQGRSIVKALHANAKGDRLARRELELNDEKMMENKLIVTSSEHKSNCGIWKSKACDCGARITIEREIDA